MTAATPNDTPAREQRVSDEELACRTSKHVGELVSEIVNGDALLDLRDARAENAAQAEQIATLEREIVEARELVDANELIAQAAADIGMEAATKLSAGADKLRRRADAAEARIVDLTRQLAEAERAGMERAARICDAAWFENDKPFPEVLAAAIRAVEAALMIAPDDKDARIARLVELEAKATRAPWNSGGIRPTTVEKGTVHVHVDQPYEKYVVRAVYSTPQGRCTQFVAEMLTTARHEEETPANAALIAAVRNELPWLLDQARAAAEARADLDAIGRSLEFAGYVVSEDWKHDGKVFDLACRAKKIDVAEATVARLERENAALRVSLRETTLLADEDEGNSRAGSEAAAILRRAARLLAPTTSTERTDA